MKIADTQYAQSLVQVLQNDHIDHVQKDIGKLTSNIEGITKILRDDTISSQQKINFFVDNGFTKEISHLLVIVSENGDLVRLKNILFVVNQSLLALQDKISVDVTSSYKISETDLSKISHAIAHKTQKKIIIKEIIDKNILGGIKIRYDNVLFDDSISTRLDALKTSLSK